MRLFLGLITIILAATALWWLSRDLLPPKEVRLAAGGQGGGYWAIAERYRDALARDGITVEVVETSGSVENAALLARGAVDAALLQGGIAAPDDVESLGAMFIEPMLFFARADIDVPGNVADWNGLRAAAGEPGSGTAAAFESVLSAAAVPPGAMTQLPLGGADAVAALHGDDADLAVFVAPIDAPYFAPLFTDETLRLVVLDHITALARGMQQTDVITLPSGGLSLDPVIPRADVEVLGMIAHLAAVDDLHPSLVDRLVAAARKIHSGADAITRAQQFPSADIGPLPVDA